LSYILTYNLHCLCKKSTRCSK